MNIKTVLHVVASDELKEQIEKELNVEEPNLEQAKAAIDGNTFGNDGNNSTQSD